MVVYFAAITSTVTTNALSFMYRRCFNQIRIQAFGHNDKRHQYPTAINVAQYCSFYANPNGTRIENS